MRRIIFAASLAACFVLASPALAQMPGGMGGSPEGDSTGPAGDEEAQPAPQAQLPPDPEGKAEDLRLQGKCDEAIPILRRLADKGSGSEIAQFNLGLCLFDIAKAERDPQRLASVQHEAAEWIIRAANNGFSKAQLRMVAAYLDGSGVVSDPVEAGKWSLLYHSNGSRLALGLPDIPSDLQNRLDSALTKNTWAEARARARSWTPASQDSNSSD